MLRLKNPELLYRYIFPPLVVINHLCWIEVIVDLDKYVGSIDSPRFFAVYYTWLLLLAALNGSGIVFALKRYRSELLLLYVVLLTIGLCIGFLVEGAMGAGAPKT